MILEDHKVVREGLRLLLESQDDLVVVAEAGTAETALEAVSREKPDIVVLNLDLGGSSIIKQIQDACARFDFERVAGTLVFHFFEFNDASSLNSRLHGMICRTGNCLP